MKKLFKVFDPNAEFEELYYETAESASLAVEYAIKLAMLDGGPCMVTVTIAEMPEELWKELVEINK